jgi:hypothetical protein
MAKVQDRRFEAGDWPIRVDVPKEQADSWLKCFYAQCEKRGWSSSSIGQFEARENSGSITVNTGGADNRQLAVVWERKLDGPLQVRARSAGVPEFPLTDAQEFFDRGSTSNAAPGQRNGSTVDTNSNTKGCRGAASSG